MARVKPRQKPGIAEEKQPNGDLLAGLEIIMKGI